MKLWDASGVIDDELPAVVEEVPAAVEEEGGFEDVPAAAPPVDEYRLSTR